MRKFVVFLFNVNKDKFASRLEVQATDLQGAINKALSVASGVEAVIATEVK